MVHTINPASDGCPPQCVQCYRQLLNAGNPKNAVKLLMQAKVAGQVKEETVIIV